jgi:hypothetical protein
VFGLASPTGKWREFGFGIIALAMLVILTQTSGSPAFSQYTCIGIGGWPCGYVGPFSGDYYGGYATVGCTPLTANGTCAVPQIAVETSYLVINNTSYVIDWANQSFQFGNRLVDRSAVSVTGRLDVIFYNKTAGSTYWIYYSNAYGLWNPQPRLRIENATLTAQSSTSCTTTLTFTVSGSSNGVWNLPMIPAGDCYTIANMPEQSATADSTGIPYSGALLLASSVAAFLVAALALAFIRKRRKAGPS